MARPTDQQLETAIAGMLRWGLTVASVIVLAGGVLYLIHSPAGVPDYRHFHATAAPLRTISGVLAGVARGDGASLIQVGLLLLIATPVVRVVFCVVGFARQRDALYVTVSTVVLLVLLYSLSFGGH